MSTNSIELSAEVFGKFGCVDENEKDDITKHDNMRVKCGTCKCNNDLLSLGKVKEWGQGVGHEEVDYIEHWHDMALLLLFYP